MTRCAGWIGVGIAIGTLATALTLSTARADDGSPTAAPAKEKAKPEAAAATPAPLNLPIGEQLVYGGTLEKAGVSFDVGKATFTVTRNEEGRTVLSACASGEKFGYSLMTQVTSTLDESSCRPELYHYLQAGSEQREKKLHFNDKTAIYEREKHCMEPDCKRRAHFILRRATFGKDEFVHCGDRDCRIPAHRHWKRRREHELDRRHFDMLSAVYYARTLGLQPGDDPIEVPVINDHDRWIVQAAAREGGRIKVPAGVFQTYKLTLEPRPSTGTDPKEEFKGLFGLNGTIHIWIDKKSKRPVLVSGKLPFAFMDLHARVELQSISQTDRPAKLQAK